MGEEEGGRGGRITASFRVTACLPLSVSHPATLTLFFTPLT